MKKEIFLFLAFIILTLGCDDRVCAKTESYVEQVCVSLCSFYHITPQGIMSCTSYVTSCHPEQAERCIEWSKIEPVNKNDHE